VGEDIEALRFNTAISQMMIFVNEVTKTDMRPRQLLEPFVLVVAPFAPHIAEELWHRLGHTASLAREPWPSYDQARLQQKTVEVILQVNGKLRSRIAVAVDTAEHDLELLALADENVVRNLNGKTPLKAIVVKNKLVNLVVP
jgi:leucyl-tRNA synthetase